MKIKYLLFLLITTLQMSSILGQKKIDGAYAFQGNPKKKYALYIPSSYDSMSPNKAVLALHPYNTRRWNATTWRDKLTDFAEMNGLILICPDGDADGKIDDPIDTAFTSSLLDSCYHWYHINSKKLFIMGFSWGGRTCYTYGLRRAYKFAGFIPMSPAINGISLFKNFLNNANNKPFYLICGSRDNPTQRFYAPMKALRNSGAIVNDSLLANVGHTVDYPGSTKMFDIAFDWIDSVSTRISTSTLLPNDIPGVTVFPNPVRAKQAFTLKLKNQSQDVFLCITDVKGQIFLRRHFNDTEFILPGLPAGNYILSIRINRSKEEQIPLSVYR